MRSQRGNYSIFFGLVVTIMLGFGAYAIDLSYIELANMEAQALADSASHAAFVAYRVNNDTSQADRAAQLMIEQNRVVGHSASIAELQLGRWEDEHFTISADGINAARVQVARTGDDALELMLAPILGMHRVDVTAESITVGRTREIMIVQDITGSFVDDIAEAKVANLAFIDAMLENPYPGDKIGMSTFVGGVAPSPWTPLQPIEGMGASMRSQWETLNSCNCALDYWDGDWCRIYYGGYDEWPWMQDCFDHGYQTAPGPGIDQAIDELLAHGDATSFQALILVSDGLPCCGGLTADRMAHGIEAADRAWEEGIHVWTVTFMNGGGDFSYLASLVRGQGQAYLTPDPSALTAIMLEIQASIPVVLVE